MILHVHLVLLFGSFIFNILYKYFRYRVQLSDVADGMDQIIHPELDPEGRAIVEFMGQRKTSVAKVKVIKPGSGKFVIQHVDFMDIENDITYFFE